MRPLGLYCRTLEIDKIYPKYLVDYAVYNSLF